MPTRFVTNPGRPGRKPLRRPARSRKNPSRRIGGVEAIYMGRVAGASRAVDGNGVEYKLDPEAVAEMGLRKGDAVVVRAVPGRFATFRKTVARKNPSPTLTVWSVSGSATDRQLGRMFPTGWTRLSDGHIATLASYANKVRGVSANVVGTMPLAEVMRKQIKNPAHLAHPGKFRQGQVVRLRGSRKRYVIATDVDPDVFGYHLVALSGGEVGSAPSGVRANDLELDADQTVSFSGAQAHKLARKYENTARVHQEHQRWLASEYPVSRRKNPTALVTAGIAGAAFVGGVLVERRMSLTGQIESGLRRKKAEAEREAKRLKSRSRSAARGAVRDVERRGREAVEDVKDRARRATRELRTARRANPAHLINEHLAVRDRLHGMVDSRLVVNLQGEIIDLYIAGVITDKRAEALAKRLMDAKTLAQLSALGKTVEALVNKPRRR